MEREKQEKGGGGGEGAEGKKLMMFTVGESAFSNSLQIVKNPNQYFAPARTPNVCVYITFINAAICQTENETTKKCRRDASNEENKNKIKRMVI